MHAHCSIAISSSDLMQEMKVDMPVAYNMVMAAAQSLMESAGRFCEEPCSEEAQEVFSIAAQGVLEGTMQARPHACSATTHSLQHVSSCMHKAC